MSAQNNRAQQRYKPAARARAQERGRQSGVQARGTMAPAGASLGLPTALASAARGWALRSTPLRAAHVELLHNQTEYRKTPDVLLMCPSACGDEPLGTQEGLASGSESIRIQLYSCGFW